MRHQDDPRLEEAKSLPVTGLVARMEIAGLKQQSGELIGPCPLCGGRDRFGINLGSCAFLCRKCGIRGGDQVALVQQVMNYGFLDALSWLCGDKPVDIDPQELARRRAKAEDAEQLRLRDAARYRRKAIEDSRRIWRSARPASQSPMLRKYLERRGITKEMLPALPVCLRFIENHPYLKKINGQFVVPHRGPAMIAAIQGPDGVGTAVHQTWLDVSQSNGKAAIYHNGEKLSSKMVRGSKKAGCIRLITPQFADTLVVGEGIETTLTAMVAGACPNAAYWVGVDLGNMSGRQKRIKGIRNSGIPDMTDRDAFIPPDWVRRLVFIMDGDSEPKMTRAKLECGLKRAMACRPGLKGQIVQAGAGVDLNDVLTRGNQESVQS